MSVGHISLVIVIIIAVFTVLRLSFFLVREQSVAIIECLGKYRRMAFAGFNMKYPFIDRIVGRVSLRIFQLDVDAETKTKDNVFVTCRISVQYRVKKDHAFDAFYKLNDAREQIKAYVFDVVRAQIPSMILDDVFERKDSVALAIGAELTDTMSEFGYEIVKTLMTDINPDERVKNAMNEINEQQRLRVAAQEKGEAEKIIRVKQAEGEAESMRLRGEGVANARKAIVEGLSDSIGHFQQAIPNSSSMDVMTMVLITQYFDTLREIGANGKNSSILLPHSPSGFAEIAAQLRESMITGNILGKDDK